MSDEQNIYIIEAVFEYINCARDKYMECHRDYAMETERSLHYLGIINKGNDILVELTKNDEIEIEYNISEYIKGLNS